MCGRQGFDLARQKKLTVLHLVALLGRQRFALVVRQIAAAVTTGAGFVVGARTGPVLVEGGCKAKK